MFENIAYYLTLALCWIGGIGATIATLIFTFKVIMHSAFGEKFDDWWDARCPF
ncbi:hypothetical protein [Bernardetia sp.]|uniref:hypothetical protein n=1 Tax=Bernardetia sp. TaxID=1937974 RepID=UPI0025C3DC19|nr:hypothetical protein [Bernardetia sp.]